jgi:hypothetical protein
MSRERRLYEDYHSAVLVSSVRRMLPGHEVCMPLMRQYSPAQPPAQ